MCCIVRLDLDHLMMMMIVSMLVIAKEGVFLMAFLSALLIFAGIALFALALRSHGVLRPSLVVLALVVSVCALIFGHVVVL
jgi:hypothetical protein